jgi:hypothetical protein
MMTIDELAPMASRCKHQSAIQHFAGSSNQRPVLLGVALKNPIAVLAAVCPRGSPVVDNILDEATVFNRCDESRFFFLPFQFGLCILHADVQREGWSEWGFCGGVWRARHGVRLALD